MPRSVAEQALFEALNGENILTIEQVKEIIYARKNDCVGLAQYESKYEQGFYNGEMNAFYICLDLLEKLKGYIPYVPEKLKPYNVGAERLKESWLSRRVDVIADLLGMSRTVDQREILDKAIAKLKDIPYTE